MREQEEADPSGSTAQFRAFVDRSAAPDATQQWDVTQQWDRRGGGGHGRKGRTAAIVIGAVVVAAVIALVLVH